MQENIPLKVFILKPQNLLSGPQLFHPKLQKMFVSYISEKLIQFNESLKIVCDVDLLALHLNYMAQNPTIHTKSLQYQSRSLFLFIFMGARVMVEKEGWPFYGMMRWVVDTQTYSLNHIDANIRTQDSTPWRLTGIYRHSEEERKVETWGLMQHLHARGALPWVCLGDFNEILSSDKKNGGIPRQVTPMLAFRHTLLQYALVDLGFRGYRFTWRNDHSGAAFVEERLDRCVATMEWRDRFRRATVHLLAMPYSDHDPVLLDMAPSNHPQR